MPRKRNYVKRVRSRVKRPSRRQVKSGGLAVGRLLKRSAKGSLALTTARKIIPNIAGSNQGSLDKIGAGLMLKLLGQGGNSMIEVGGAEFGANMLDRKIMPIVMSSVSPAFQQTQSAVSGTVESIAPYFNRESLTA